MKKLKLQTLSFFHQYLTLMCVWLPLQAEEAPFVALKLTYYVTHDQILHLGYRIFCTRRS